MQLPLVRSFGTAVAVVAGLALGAALHAPVAFAQATEGPLYRAEGDAGVVYLFGTVHFGREDFYPLSRPVYDALDASSVMLVEADIANLPQDQALKVMAMMALPKGETLDGVIGEALWERTSALASRYRMPPASLRPLRPWSVAMLLSLVPYTNAGLQPLLGVDVHMLEAARERDVRIVELENVEDQLGIFDALGDDEQRELLRKTVEQLEGPEAEELAVETIESWKVGDADAIDRTVNDTMRQQTPALAVKLLDERNLRMAERVLEELVDAPSRTVMVVVGAAHLPGTGGLADLLGRAGFAVRQQ